MREVPSVRGKAAGTRTRVWLGCMLCAGMLTAAYAQYPGRIDTKKKPAQSLRAVGVLEWTGQAGKPSASRLIPLSVFDGEDFQPGGLYLARPEPLALDSGTEYVLEHAGVAQGLFDIYSAQDVQGYWFGYGAWKPLVLPPAKKLQQAKIMPQVVTQPDDSRPHFSGRQPASSKPDQNKADQTKPEQTKPDQTKPDQTKPGDTSSSQTGSSQDGSSQDGSSKDSSSASSHDGGNSPKGDPDRPTLRRRTDAQKKSDNSGVSITPETAIDAPDPDRPRLTRGRPGGTAAEVEASKLTTTPLDLQQMVAVSDATSRESHPFAYHWANADDAAKMKSALEMIARQAVAADGAAPAASPGTKTSIGKTPTARSSTARTAAGRRGPVRAAHPAQPKLPDLTEERFAAYELTYSGGATLVFTAHTAPDAGPVKYVTVIAQPDFYGKPNVVFQQVTSDAKLDATPRMQLVDAVDPSAKGRGDLVFELRSTHDRQFVIDRVGDGRVEQVFSTGPLPLKQTATAAE